MSVIFDQLRISNDGQSMFINAHVNKASYFDDIYLKRITICTEEQISELNPHTYGEDFIYQQDIEPLSSIEQLYDKTQILSEKQLLGKMLENGGWRISIEPKEGAETNALSVVLSGKFSQFDTGYTPKLVVATNAFNPLTDNLNHPEILFTIDGTVFEGKGHRVWQFKGKGDVGQNTMLSFYLFNQTGEEIYTYTRLDVTDDFNFLHFLWQGYSVIPESNQKEVHLVLNNNSFNEKFKYSDMSHNMFFVYIECEGTPAVDTPCMLDEMTTLGVTFDYGAVFNPAMNITRELADTCKIPQNFLDFILNYDALKIALETEHYVPAIEYWNRLMVNGQNIGSGTTKLCGCHG